MPAPAPVPAPAPAQPSSPLTNRQAANLLRGYLENNPTPEAFGYQGHPSALVARFQRHVGINDDGIVGRQTRDAAAAAGVTLPPRPQPATITRARTVRDVSQPRRPAPAPAQPSSPLTNRQAANLLRGYLANNPTPEAFGYQGHPSALVARFQRHVGINDDGIVGRQTRDAAAAAGVTLPPRPQTAQATPAPAPAASSPLTNRQAANLLRNYLASNPTPEAFGYKGHPSEVVERFQRHVGIKDDGIVGKQTRTAAKRAGVTLPDRPK